MPSCPNCGRKTLRTLDWACQWCGYPLLSKSYKKIDKTFKELQEERNLASKAATTKPEPEHTPEPEPEITPEPEAGPVYEPASQAETALAPPLEPEPPPKHEPEPISPPPEEPKTAGKRKSKDSSKKESKQEKQPEPEPEVTPTPQPASEQTPIITPPPQAASGQEPIITPPPAPASTSPKPEPPPVSAPKPETLTNGDTISVDVLDALFRENKVTAHTGLKDKTMNITGIVEKVFIRDHIDVRYVVLRGSQKKLLWPVRCTFSKEVLSEMHRLNEGQEVTMQGKYDSYGKNIIFKDCVLTR